jgi:outer membrane protein assembly factor BamB
VTRRLLYRTLAAALAVAAGIVTLAVPIGAGASGTVIRCGTGQPNQPDIASAYQIGVRHSGGATDTTVNPPLQQKWSVTLPGPVSYPVIAQDKVFVTVANPTPTGSKLYALDRLTGAEVWHALLKGTTQYSNLAFDRGCIIALDGDGHLLEYVADTGVKHFQIQMPNDTECSSPPVARDNKIFVSCGNGTVGHVYRVAESNGHVTWSTQVNGGQHGGPTLSHGTLIASYNCGQVYALEWLTGSINWHKGTTTCEGGRIPAFSGQLLYVRDGHPPIHSTIYERYTGNVVGSFGGWTIPAVSSGLAFVVNQNGTMTKFNPNTGATIATWSPPVAGEEFTAAPIIEGSGTVYAGTDLGNVYALNASTGAVTWTGDAHAPVSAPDETVTNGSKQPLPGMNVGEGMLIVSAGSTLTAFGP